MDVKSYHSAFLRFVPHLKIDSKDYGTIPLKPMRPQLFLLEQIFKGIEEGARAFYILKGRQMGISTISIALDLFWALMHEGLQGAIITHTDEARQQFRNMVERYLESLPPGRVKAAKRNRDYVSLTNGAIQNYLVAGTRKKGTLGRGLGLNFIHATECSSWGDEEGLASLNASLSTIADNRLYIFESTARGFNMWHDMYEEAKDHPEKRAIFLGWWMKETYALARNSKAFKVYWDGVYTPEEKERIHQVKLLYNYTVTEEQIAWYRMTQASMVSENLMQQEYPWTEREAFVSSGSSFFQPRILADLTAQAHKKKFLGYKYLLGDNFLAMKIDNVKNAKEAELRVWEEPDPDGVYVLGADPAYGENEDSDRSVVQVLRCYADKAIQVAEYAREGVATNQFAWVLSHLAGAYRTSMVNIEITGPGTAVWQEILHLKQALSVGHMREEGEERGLRNLFGSMRWYLYRRLDGLNAQPTAYHWKTSFENKRRILHQTRDSLIIRALELNSIPLLNEMENVVYESGSIAAEGNRHDDRVMALALAHVAWTDGKGPLIVQKRTYANEMLKKERADQGVANDPFIGQVLQNFLHNASMGESYDRMVARRSMRRRRR